MRGLRKIVSSVFDSSGSEVFTQRDIESVHVDYYTDLFSPSGIDL